ncbi:glycosyltransferase family 2 protein [Flavobacterium johnsoniae]|uniref:Glycosyltransferase 2-like domain-containing protein n=1 Tax=Flavobacterium johnsoniae TaxID=986 RepID=A0A1J7CBS9_FLAJO|nr:glycosyltransferase family 2 protein [Flavobacterium johnsoniae]OIV43209.1 hypothetical protein BKM63_03075 [Flavobacterium johnsoniae]
MVSIIIVNYNTREITFNCIQSIFEHTQLVEFEVIVVDNASSDGSREYIKTNFPTVKVISSKENVGFGRANNLGAKYAKGDFLFLLNSDTILIENSIQKFISFFTENEKKLNIGVLGTLLVDEKLEHNGFGNSFPTCDKENRKNWRKIPFLRSFLLDPIAKTYDFEKEYFEIDYVIGADMFIRKELFDKMNGFSEDFFMYYEESDLQKRISNLGYRQYVFTNTKIIHLEEVSGKVIENYSNRKRIITHQSRVVYLKKNDLKNFYKYVISDFLFLSLNFLNLKYTMSENLKYFKEVAKKY